MKRLYSLCLCCTVFLLSVIPVRAVSTSASSAILIDAQSGRVLYEQNAHEPRYIASITKLMTALVAMESGHSLDETVTIKREYTGAEGSSMYLREGEELTLEALMYGLLLASGNDAALAVAGFCGGTVEEFVSRMNRKAVLLGMENTRFINPSGLTQEGHVSTAADMAKLAAACMKNEAIAEMVATRTITIGGRTFTNHNKLLWRYDGCIGMKTGYTERSGRTLISCAQREGQRLIAVTLNDGNDWADHTAMLDYGYASFTRTCLSRAGEVYARIPVSGSLLSFVHVQAADDIYYPLAAGEQVREEVSLTQWTQAPVSRGQTAGTITYYLNDEVVAVCPLIYGESVGMNVVNGRNFIGRIFDLFGL